MNNETASQLLDSLWQRPKSIKGLRSLRLRLTFEDNSEVRATLWEQNPNKSSTYATRARNGERLAWIIGDDNQWYALVTDKEIEWKIGGVIYIGVGADTDIDQEVIE